MRSKNVRFSFLVLMVFVLALALAACGDDDEPEATPVATEERSVTLGLSLADLSNPFFVSVQEGAQQAADRAGVTLLVEDAAEDSAQQVEQIQAWIDAGVDALLINPVTEDDIVSAIEAANEAEIPVFTIDRSASGGTVISHIASDNVAGGRMAGEYLAETLNKSGKIVELEGIPGTSAAQARGEGFNEAIATYEDIEIVAREVANFNFEEGKAVFAKILADNAEINGVFAHNDNMILGALEAAREADRAGEIVFVGFDAIEDAIAAVEAGDLRATIAQQPAEMGRIGVETALAHLNGEEVEADIPVDLALITN